MFCAICGLQDRRWAPSGRVSSSSATPCGEAKSARGWAPRCADVSKAGSPVRLNWKLTKLAAGHGERRIGLRGGKEGLKEGLKT